MAAVRPAGQGQGGGREIRGARHYCNTPRRKFVISAATTLKKQKPQLSWPRW